MAYSKNTWATGDVITAEKLNSIENAVGNVSSSVDSMAPSVAKIDNIEDSIGDINSEISSMAPTLAKVNPLESAVQSLSSEIASARNYNSSGTANTLGGRIDELVRISNTQPGGNNEIWVNSGNGVVETEVPTYQEFNKLKNSNAPEYSNNAIYAVGEYVFHDGNLYRCQTAITTAETWTAVHWTQVVFGNEVKDLNSALLLSIASRDKVTRIPDNTDYDILLTAGNYVVKSASSAATMVHCPTTSGHRLFVLEVVETTRILQIIITNDVQPKIYKRYYRDTWGDWTYIADDVDLNNIKDDILTNIIDPDEYTGTDNQKLASAITAAGYDKNSVIIIRRMYTLTDNVLLNHNHECTGKMIFLGIGDECGFNMAQYGFRSPDTSTRGMISFVNLQFNATNIYFDCDHLIRLYFENCSFNGGNRVLYSTRYIQTVYFHNCVIRECAKSVVESRHDGTEGSKGAIYDMHFVECTIEKCNGFIELYRGIGCSVSDCCIEALSNHVLKVSHSVNGVVFDSNYFEENNTGYYAPENWNVGAGDGTMFDLRTTAEYDTKPNHLVITNNMIYQPSGTGVIKLRAEPYEKGHVIVKNNVCSGASNIILIATASGTTKIHNDVVIEGNTNALYTNENYLVIDGEAVSELKNSVPANGTNEAQAADDVNSLSRFGYYHASANNDVLHAPTTGEFYLLHIKNGTSFSQIAITETGVRSRIGTGAWI